MDLLADEPVVKKPAFIDMLTDEPVESVPIPKIIGQEKPQSMFEKYILESGPIQDVKTGVGLAETALSMGTGIVGMAAGGLTKLAKAPFVGLDEAEKTGQSVTEALTYEPRTKRGEDIGKLISYPVEKLSEYGGKRADLELKESGSPIAAAAKKTLYDIAPYLIGTKGAIKGAKAARGRLVKAKEAAKVPEFKNSQDAIKFGKDATPEQIKTLRILRDKTLIENERLLKESKDPVKADKLQESMDVGFKAQLYNEAVLSAEGRKQLAQGPVIKHRKVGKDLYAPKVRYRERQTIQEMKELPKEMTHKTIAGWLENPIRTMEDLGSRAKKLYYDTIKDAEYSTAVERVAFKGSLIRLKKGISRKSSKNIYIHAASQQKGGLKRLNAMGIKNVPKLSAKEQAIYKSMRTDFESFYKRLQVARKEAGKEPFPKVDNYFTFMQDMTTMERLGFNPVLTDVSTIKAQFLHMKTTPFRFAKARGKEGVRKLDLDAFGAFEKYGESAIKHIHMSPKIAYLRETLGVFGEKGDLYAVKAPGWKRSVRVFKTQKEATAFINKAPKSKRYSRIKGLKIETLKGKGAIKKESRWSMQEEKPKAYNFLSDWLDFQAGQKVSNNIPMLVEKSMLKLNKNLTYAILSANARSALIQPSAIVNTYAYIGPKYTAKGIASLFSPEKRYTAMNKSKHLFMRADYIDVSMVDMLANMKEGKIGTAKKWAGKKGLKPLQVLDMETAKATWTGAYEMARKEMNFAEHKAIRFADDTVTRTQASAAPSDVAAIQRTPLGKSVSLFQTFVINEWGFITKDVMGLKNAKITNKQAVRRAVRYMIGATLINILYEDGLGINSPHPTPIRAFQEARERGESYPSAGWEVAKEVGEKLPIVGGGLRYGKGITGAGFEIVRDLLTEKTIKVETIAKIGGVPGTAQIAKSIRARKRGESPYGQLVGQYTKAYGKKKKLKKLKGL